MIVWVGSVVSVFGTLVASLIGPYSVETVLVIIAGFVYLLGVQGLTVLVHLRLNRRIQTVNVGGGMQAPCVRNVCYLKPAGSVSIGFAPS